MSAKTKINEDDEVIDPSDGLTIKQRLFCHQYVLTLNATKAALRAGYSEGAARQIGSENLSKPAIKRYIESLFDAAKMGPKEVIGQLTALSRADIGNYLEEVKVLRNGEEVSEWRFNLIKAMNDGNTGMIKSIKRDRYGVVVEIFNKERLLELIGKHYRLFADVSIASTKQDATADDLDDDELARIAREGDQASEPPRQPDLELDPVDPDQPAEPSNTTDDSSAI